MTACTNMVDEATRSHGRQAVEREATFRHPSGEQRRRRRWLLRLFGRISSPLTYEAQSLRN